MAAESEHVINSYGGMVGAHETRLQRLESVIGGLGPGLARVEATMETVCDRLDSLHCDVRDVKGQLVAEKLKDVESGLATDIRLQGLEKSEKKRVESRGAVLKWVVGIASPIIIAALLIALKLK